jgi:cyanophycinase-like exopeptidase
MGRMLTFLARLANGDAVVDQKNIDPKLYRAIGMDEETAFLLDINTGKAQVVGNGNGYLCYPSHVPEVCKSDLKLTFKGKKLLLITFSVTN